jgi:hypothetical protein
VRHPKLEVSRKDRKVRQGQERYSAIVPSILPGDLGVLGERSFPQAA